MNKLWLRLVGEWMAIEDLIKTMWSEVKYLGKDFVRMWRYWRDEHPYRKCVECKQWLSNNAIYESGLCVSCADDPYEVRKQQWIEENGPLGEDDVLF